MIPICKKSAVVLLLLTICCTLPAQQKELTETQYFKNDFKGIIQALPVFSNWIDNSHFLLLKDSNKVMVDCVTGTEKVQTGTDIASGQSNPYPVSLPTVSLKENNIFLLLDNKEIQLTQDGQPKANPTLSPDQNFIAYTQKNDLYTIEIKTKKIARLTTDGSETILNGYASWVYTEEILGRPSKYRSFWWSPDSKSIAFFRTDDSPVPVYTITDGGDQHGYVEKQRYPKVGDPNPQIKIGIVNIETGKTNWADFNEKDDQYFAAPTWTSDSKSLLVQWLNRLQNHLDIWVVNSIDGTKKIFYKEDQKTWIQLQDGFERIHIVANDKIVLSSDQTGWNQLYLYNLEGKLLNRITEGKFTVLSIIRLTEKEVFFTARSKENSARIDLYKAELNGKNLRRLTQGAYNNSNISISPDGSYFLTNCSNVTTPNKLVLYNSKGQIIREIANSKGLQFDNYSMAKTAFLRVTSDDSLYELPLKITWPVNMDPNKKYPVLISIYGGPNAGTCWDTWNLSGAQQWYAKEGLIQVVMDHRASGHFGKEGVNYLYHNLGYWEMKDYSTMVRWLIKNGQADPTKICITGFSYGGYMTCYALTYGADIFTHGMAGGAVTDWSYYDSHYTERYMGTLSNNPEGYKSSSVLSYTNKYKGMLQIVHGVIDDNVHIQNSINLISKLQDGKKDFEFMEYSGGRHGWGGSKGLHFQNLKTKFIYKYLLEKPVPPALLK